MWIYNKIVCNYKNNAKQHKCDKSDIKHTNKLLTKYVV